MFRRLRGYEGAVPAQVDSIARACCAGSAPRDDEQVCAAAEHGGLGLDESRGVEQGGAALRILQAVGQVRQDPAGPFDAVECVDGQARSRDFGAEVIGTVKVSRREIIEMVGWVAVLAIAKVSIDDGHECRVGEQVAGKSVEQGTPARDRGRDQHSARAEDTGRLAQRRVSIFRLDEMVERTEQQHDVGSRVGERQCSRVAYLT